MSAEYHIDPTHQLIRVRCWGTLTDDDIRGHQARLRLDPEFRPNLSQLVDTREVTDVAVSLEAVKQLGSSTLFQPEARRAYVVTKDVLYGLVRMYELYQNFRGSQHIRAFRDRSEALRWLGVADATVDDRHVI